MKPMIDPEFARKAMEKAVASKGEDHVYEQPDNQGCLYTYATETGHERCIVGEAMVLAGVVDDDWFSEEPVVNTVGPGRLLAHLKRTGHISGYTDSALNALAVAQSSQDQGRTWGDALEAFEEELEAQLKEMK